MPTFIQVTKDAASLTYESSKVLEWTYVLDRTSENHLKLWSNIFLQAILLNIFWWTFKDIFLLNTHPIKIQPWFEFVLCNWTFNLWDDCYYNSKELQATEWRLYHLKLIKHSRIPPWYKTKKPALGYYISLYSVEVCLGNLTEFNFYTCLFIVRFVCKKK